MSNWKPNQGNPKQLESNMSNNDFWDDEDCNTNNQDNDSPRIIVGEKEKTADSDIWGTDDEEVQNGADNGMENGDDTGDACDSSDQRGDYAYQAHGGYGGRRGGGNGDRRGYSNGGRSDFDGVSRVFNGGERRDFQGNGGGRGYHGGGGGRGYNATNGGRGPSGYGGGRGYNNNGGGGGYGGSDGGPGYSGMGGGRGRGRVFQNGGAPGGGDRERGSNYYSSSDDAYSRDRRYRDEKPFHGNGGGGDYGSRNGGRGEYGNRDGGRNENNDELAQKPREFYIPPEPTNDEKEIFDSGIRTGLNFFKYDAIPIKVTGENVPPPLTTFADAGLSDVLLTNIQKSGYKTPTPIQKIAIPIIRAKRDLMACAQTGSGKTAAFLVPLLDMLMQEKRPLTVGEPHVLIISPTRELSLQIYNEARKFSFGTSIKTSLIYGGTSSKHQGESIAKGCHILICTMGRLLDFVNRGFLSFGSLRHVVLDEADRMLDMGFRDHIPSVIRHKTIGNADDLQLLMFSATFPNEVQVMAGQYLRDYVFITVGIVGGACSDVTQKIMKVGKFDKRKKLIEILTGDCEGTIVFVETKRGADFLASLLCESDFPTTSIHGDRLQSQREMALTDFKSGKMKILIATAVAARGLDIKNVKHVINYDLPKTADEYVHRIGRTGRVGNDGRATSFFDPDVDRDVARNLVPILMGANQEVPDFLKESHFESSANGDDEDEFGGSDVRPNYKTQEHSMPMGVQEPESWD